MCVRFLPCLYTGSRDIVQLLSWSPTPPRRLVSSHVRSGRRSHIALIALRASPIRTNSRKEDLLSLQRCPTESVNPIAGSDELLHRPIEKTYRGDLAAHGAGDIRYIVVGRDDDFVRRRRHPDRASDLCPGTFRSIVMLLLGPIRAIPVISLHIILSAMYNTSKCSQIKLAFTTAGAGHAKPN